MTQITFNELPEVVSDIRNEIKELKQLFLKNSIESQPEEIKWFDLDGLVDYDPEGRTKPTFYGYISKGIIPYHKRGKKLTFLKSEIDLWLKEGRKKTSSEIEAAANQYFINKKGNKR